MILGRLRHRHAPAAAAEAVDETVIEIDPSELTGLFAAPRWLRDLGLMSWFLVGVIAVLVAATWVLGITSTIVDPVVTGAILAIVTSPVVSALKRRRVPRAVGAALMILALFAVGAIVLALVLRGLIDNSDQITSSVNHAVDRISEGFKNAGANNTQHATESTKSATTSVGRTLLQGVANGIAGLTSLAFFLSFMLLATFFLLKDGPTLRQWIDRHVGLPLPVAQTISTNVLVSLRRYFLGVTIVAAFNGVVVGVGAQILGVPLAGSIAVVTFVTAYVPYVGAFVAGAYAVLLALGTQGVTIALIMLAIVILANGMLQNIFQPIAFGATLRIHPLAVLIVTIGGGCLFGAVGLILAAPLTSAAVHISGELKRARAEQAAEEPEAPPAVDPAPAVSG